jgi:hypothetical protein
MDASPSLRKAFAIQLRVLRALLIREVIRRFGLNYLTALKDKPVPVEL